MGDIQWVGAFRLPQGTFGPSRFGYGGRGPGYYKDTSNRETLYMEGHAWYKGNVAQVQIPTPSSSRSFDVLPRATLLQSFHDVTDGNLGGASGDGIGSLLPYNGKLIVGSYEFYDGAGDQETTIGQSSLDLAPTNDFKGFFAPSGINPGRLGGYMSLIPTEWRSLLGGPALNGNCCLSIISRTNSGPGVSVFDPANVGTLNPVPFREVLGYPLSNPVKFGNEQGGCSVQNNVFNCTTKVVGVALPTGTRSVLFFGRHGTGPVCYKDSGPASCQGTGGYNAPPYRPQVWAYDANDLVAVKNGQKQPFEVQPYAVWSYDFQFNGASVDLVGGTYDPDTKRMFLIEDNGEDPIVHVLKVNTTGTGDVVAPGAPKNLRQS